MAFHDDRLRDPVSSNSIVDQGSGALSRRRVLAGSGAALAAIGLAGLAAPRERGAAAPVRAAQTTPGATPAAGADEAFGPEELAQLVQSVHPEKAYFYLPGFEDEALRAAVYGLDLETYREITGRFDAAARQAAQDLLADPAFAGRVDRLPFAPGATVIGVGESDMDDRQSWLEILRHLLDLRRPQDRIAVINQGISGQSTAEALFRFVGILYQRPAWIICALGGNDAVRYGRQPTKTRVSIEETAKNLAELRHLAATQSTANCVWVTRWPIDEARIAAYPPFRQAQFNLRSEDMDAVIDAVRRQPEPVVDLEPVIGRPPTLDFLQPDGLHPSLAGHRAIARALVERLTA